MLSFPRGTEMFQFPRFPPLGLFYSAQGDRALPLPGFPIRISTDRGLVGGSPWLIAATHVLHRHLAPRHPPLALCSLEIFKDARARYAVLKERAGRTNVWSWSTARRLEAPREERATAHLATHVGARMTRPRSFKTEQWCDWSCPLGFVPREYSTERFD